MSLEAAVGGLLRYAVANGLIARSDWDYARNRVLEILGETEYDLSREVGALAESAPGGRSIDDMLRPILDDAVARGLIEVDTVARRDLLDAAIMGALLPPHSIVSGRFWDTYGTDAVQATDDYYHQSIASNYIRKARTDRNLKWIHDCDYGAIQMTVNLSKPEKDPRDIAAAAAADETPAYPTCLLCPQNEGYAGRLDHPARQNLRLIDLSLPGNDPSGADEPWFLQYSPYQYYPEHSIFLSAEHRPMAISRAGLLRLFAIIDTLPHYFVGSNADLPIVGGSILTHDHFQGGRHRFPIQEAGPVAAFTGPDLGEGVTAQVVRWPLATIRLTASDPLTLVDRCDRLLERWRDYSDPGLGVLAESYGQPHNTITPIARRLGQDYQVDLVLRNNRTSVEHPDGIYHPHAEIHPVKKENIGLIEVMGLAVLPARLLTEMDRMTEALVAGTERLTDDLAVHDPMYRQVRESGGVAPDRAAAEALVRAAVADDFVTGLEHCGVFGQGDSLIEGMDRFGAELGWVLMPVGAA